METRRHISEGRRGVTLVEVTLAGSITALLVLVLLESLIFGARVARSNSQLLAADAYAFDVAWRHCNESFASMPSALRNQQYSIASNAAPAISLAGWPAAVCYVTVTNAGTGKAISVDVEWGPSGRRKRLSDTHATELYKSQVERSVK